LSWLRTEICSRGEKVMASWTGITKRTHAYQSETWRRPDSDVTGTGGMAAIADPPRERWNGKFTFRPKVTIHHQGLRDPVVYIGNHCRKAAAKITGN